MSVNAIAEKLSEWFGSTPFILFHVVWFILWFVTGMPQELLTLIVSLEAIFLSLFILRAENIQGKRIEEYIKETRKFSKKDLEATRRLEKTFRYKL